MRPTLIATATLVAVVCSLSAAAAVTFPKTAGVYLQLDGIAGEVDEADFKGQIELQSFSLAGQRPDKDGEAAKLADFFVLKALDAASPKLLAAFANGQKIAKATVTIRGGKDAKTYLKYEFTDVAVSRINQVVSGSGQEELNFRYAAVKVTYTGADGKPVEGEAKK
jgi:type VI secretion system secreted protein Hcp